MRDVKEYSIAMKMIFIRTQLIDKRLRSRIEKKITDTSWGRPFQPPSPVPPTFDIRFEEAIGLGLLCRSLSKSPNPWLGIIPETRNISAHKRAFYLRKWSEIKISGSTQGIWDHTQTKIKGTRKKKELQQGKKRRTMHGEEKLVIVSKNCEEISLRRHHFHCHIGIKDKMTTPWMLIQVISHIHLVQTIPVNWLISKLYKALKFQPQKYEFPQCHWQAYRWITNRNFMLITDLCLVHSTYTKCYNWIIFLPKLPNELNVKLNPYPLN